MMVLVTPVDENLLFFLARMSTLLLATQHVFFFFFVFVMVRINLICLLSVMAPPDVSPKVNVNSRPPSSVTFWLSLKLFLLDVGTMMRQ